MLLFLLTGCVSHDPALSDPSNRASGNASATTGAPLLAQTAPPTTSPTTTPPLTRPRWLGLRALETRPDGSYKPVDTPPQLLNRSFPTENTLPPPPDEEFHWSISPFEGEPLERSTYKEDCPVPAKELLYLTMSFWGFDGLHHTGEMVVHGDSADNITQVFSQLHAARFPIEEMRLVTPADLTGISSGDTNNTTAYVCRSVTGGRRWSDHALGTAIDVNPFHNPYKRGEIVLPGLAADYLDRESPQPGMILRDNVVVNAFADIGWSWGGDWVTVTDYQHFSLSGN
jgi:hypothetical protein